MINSILVCALIKCGDPCADAKCERFPFAECRAECCVAKFYLFGQEVDCSKFRYLELIYSLINFTKSYFIQVVYFQKKNRLKKIFA